MGAALLGSETWDCLTVGGVMENSTFLNLVTWRQGGVGASEKQEGLWEQRTLPMEKGVDGEH